MTVMSITREQIVTEARTWIGTPFHHQGRVKGVGGDCIAVIAKTAHNLDISQFDTVNYSRQPDPEEMGRLLDEHLDRITLAEVDLGDILWLKFERHAQHLGIVTQLEPTLMIVHAFNWPGIQRCVEQSINDNWRKRIVRCYRYRGII